MKGASLAGVVTIGLAGLAVLAGALIAHQAEPAGDTGRALPPPSRSATAPRSASVTPAPTPTHGTAAPSLDSAAGGQGNLSPGNTVAQGQGNPSPVNTVAAGQGNPSPGNSVAGGRGNLSPSVSATGGSAADPGRSSSGSAGQSAGAGAAAGYAVGNVVGSGTPPGTTATDTKTVPKTADSGTRPATDGDGSKATPPPAPAGPVTVRLVPDAAGAAIGQRVTVHVLVDNASDVTSVPFHLGFDPAVLKYESSTNGGFLGSDGHSATVLVAPTLAGNMVVFGAARLGPGPGINGSGELASLAFRVVGSGSTLLSISDASVWNSQNEAVPANFQPASISAR